MPRDSPSIEEFYNRNVIQNGSHLRDIVKRKSERDRETKRK